MTSKPVLASFIFMLSLYSATVSANVQTIDSPSPSNDLTIGVRGPGFADATPLRGANGNLILPFGIRLDETVAKATLHLRYSYSPSLIPELSHLNVLLNKEVVATIPLPKQTVSGEVVKDIEIDPRYFSDYNQLVIELIGHYSNDCEDAMHSSIWASISGKSKLQLSMRKLALATDLSSLPVPFFDRRDNQRLVLPFVFGDKPSIEVLNAAGVVSSWFGAQAGYRSARFPVQLNQLPEQNSIVFATNDSRPSGLILPQVKAATISVMDHPENSNIKLLVVQGQDAAQLRMAADALALGQVALSGRSATITSVKYEPRRPAYDAPNWVSSARPVKLGELVDSLDELQRVGHIADPIRVNLRLPPDLLTWNRSGVPIELKYRYTPLVAQDNSTLSISINNSFIQAYRLRPGGTSSPSNRLVVPILENGQIEERDTLIIPAFQVGSNNQLQFVFALDYHKVGQCKDTLMDAVRSAIDPDSTIDLTDFPHYTAMPNLTLFANAGFPFTKYADLAETAVVIPDQFTAADIEQMLFLLGRMGRITGAPALRFQLVGNASAAQFEDKDLLIVGGGKPKDLLSQWRKELPVLIEQGQRSFAPSARLERWASNTWGREDRKPVSYAWNVSFDTEGPLAALVGFESPLKTKRSIVAITASSPSAHGSVIDVLEDEGLVSGIRGDVTLIRGRETSAYQIGETYYVGKLHWWTRVWFVISPHPILLAILGILAVLLLALWTSSFLQRVAARRAGSA